MQIELTILNVYRQIVLYLYMYYIYDYWDG